MLSAIDQEFETVDLILKSDSETMSVDAFCLTWIKFERQLRKLTANILFQASAFAEPDQETKKALRDALLAKNNIKHDHFIGGIRKLTSLSMKDLIGERYKELRKSIDKAYVFRGKIFHGQQTGFNLNRTELIATQGNVREWCSILAKESSARFGYDGFGRNSLRKTYRDELIASVDSAVLDQGWRNFVKDSVMTPRIE